MHHSAPRLNVTAPIAARRAPASTHRLIGIAIAAAGGLLAVALLDSGVDAGAPPAAVPVAAFAVAESAGAMGRGPSMPDSARVLADREQAVEEAAPTFWCRPPGAAGAGRRPQCSPDLASREPP